MSATDEIKNYYLSLGIKESVYDSAKQPNRHCFQDFRRSTALQNKTRLR